MVVVKGQLVVVEGQMVFEGEQVFVDEGEQMIVGRLY